MFAAATLGAAAALAIVTQDQTRLLAAPRSDAASQAVLWQGETLEIRGQRLGYWQVYDHRRERAGHVRAEQVRTTSLKPADANELLHVLRFVRDTPGAEALGIGYAAAYLKAAAVQAITAEPFDALGVMAERLARRASTRQGKPETLTAHLEVAASYGVVIKGYETDGAIRLCYDGDAFRRVLADPAAQPEQQARAALALTRDDCIAPALRPHERIAHDRWRAEVLDRIAPAALASLGETTRNRLRLRRAGVWATLAFGAARRNEPAVPAAERALIELAAVNKAELADEDSAEHAEAAVRVGASRWASLAVPVAAPARLAVQAVAGEPGQTCILLIDPKQPAGAAPLHRRCTHALVWAASARTAPDAQALTLAVQPLAGWRELWVYRKAAGAWTLDVLPPAAVTSPELGYVEHAGWLPDGQRFLLAREARVDGRFKRSFEVVSVATLATEKRASDPGLLLAFGRFADPQWKRGTVSLR